MFQLANLIMKGATMAGYEARYSGTKFEWVDTIISAVFTILGPILAIVAVAGIIWAIVLGINMARADSTEKREESKKRLISLVVGIVVLVVVIVFFYTLFPSIINKFVPEESQIFVPKESQI